MRIFFSVGEPSGDLHGANLIRALQAAHPDWEFVGYGGPRMAAAGCRLHADLTQLAVMWITRVLVEPPQVHRPADARRPVLSRRAARRGRAHRLPGLQLVDRPPGQGPRHPRVLLRHAAGVGLGQPPRAEDAAVRRPRALQTAVRGTWFRERGCHATYVGHPYFDELRSQQLDDEFVRRMQRGAGPLVVILPGSRTQEVEANTAGVPASRRSRLSPACPTARFAVAAFKDSQAEAVRAGAGGRAGRANRCVRRPHAGADSRRRLLPGVLGLGVARAALPRQAERDPLPRRPGRLLDPEPVPPRAVHHAGEPADDRRHRHGSPGGDLRPRQPARRPRADAGVSHVRRQVGRRSPATPSSG